jgi:hypothetical protein
MSMELILEAVHEFDGVLVLAPDADGPFPEIAWGDYFFYYAPDGQIPQNVQPYATIVTKDYPDDARSRLDADGRWRVNIHVGQAGIRDLTSTDGQPDDHHDFAAVDTFMAHPVYAEQGWVAVVCPAQQTLAEVLVRLRHAHADARRRFERRAGSATH